MYAVIDLETTIKESYGRKANPITKDNSIVAGAVKRQDSQEPQVFYSATYNQPISGTLLRNCTNCTTLVGHNIKFDLLHLWPQIAATKYNIWDTQLAEHIISGQQRGFVSLRDLATTTYNAAIREKNMEKFWEQGICTSKIPRSIVESDVRADVLDTEQVLKGQIEKAKKLGCFNLIKAFGNGLLATAEMEWNGLQIDKCRFSANKIYLNNELENVQKELTTLCREYLPEPIVINLNSKDQISAILFGGKITYWEKQTVMEDGVEVRYKTGLKKGEVKTRLVKVEYIVNSNIGKEHQAKTKKLGVFSTDDAILEQIAKDKAGKKIGHFVELLLDYRKLFKDYSTYYTGLEKTIYHTDDCLHPQFNFVATYTGRLSSTAPNAQNLPKPGRSDVTRAIVSRYQGGKLIGFDYSQLEVIGLALLSNDPILAEELKQGTDIHRRNAALIYDKDEADITDEERQITKGNTFKLLYGGTAPSMSKTTGLSLEQCENFIAGFFKKYQKVKAFYQNVIDTVRSSRTTDGRKLADNVDQGIGQYQVFTGRILTFKESLRSSRAGISVGFSRPELMNFPVQGISTGDIAVIMLGELYRKSQEHRDKYLLVNFVHDSYIIDCRPEHVDFALQHVTNVLQSVPDVLKHLFNKQTDLPFRVKSKVGDSFYDIM